MNNSKTLFDRRNFYTSYQFPYFCLPLIASLPPLCAIFGSLLIALPMELYGRRMTLATISIPYILGFYLMGLSYYFNSIPVLFVGRLITGLISGASVPTSQIYVTDFLVRFIEIFSECVFSDWSQVSECSSPRVRGALGSFTSTFMSFGIVIAYVVGAVVEWQIMCFVMGSLPIVLGIAMVNHILSYVKVILCIDFQQNELFGLYFFFFANIY